MSSGEDWRTKYADLLAEYYSNRKAFPDDKKMELLKILGEEKLKRNLPLKEVIQEIAKETNVAIPHSTIRKWINSLICGNPSIEDKTKELFECFGTSEEEKSAPKTVNEKQEISMIERYHKDKESFVASVNLSSTHVVLANFRNFLVHPAILTAYEILKNSEIAIDGQKIPLINAVLGIESTEPVGIMTFINSAVVHFLKIIGLDVGVITSDRIKELIMEVYGIEELEMPDAYLISNVTIKRAFKKAKQKEEEAVEENASPEG